MRIRLGLLAVALLSVCGSIVSAASAGVPRRLSTSGQTLWQLEALLHDTFGGRAVAAHESPRSGVLNFACAGHCAPLAYWSPYFFTFSGARHSSFHLSAKRFSPGYFGNYPELIEVKGRTVACDRAGRRFLIKYRDAVGLSLACL